MNNSIFPSLTKEKKFFIHIYIIYIIYKVQNLGGSQQQHACCFSQPYIYQHGDHSKVLKGEQQLPYSNPFRPSLMILELIVASYPAERGKQQSNHLFLMKGICSSTRAQLLPPLLLMPPLSFLLTTLLIPLLHCLIHPIPAICIHIIKRNQMRKISPGACIQSLFYRWSVIYTSKT